MAYDGDNIMVYTFTYSPSIDYHVFLDDLNIGEFNLMSRDICYYGGKGINVSQVLSNLGVENTALGFVAGFVGDAIEKGMADMGIGCDFIRLREGRSRINLKLRGIAETEINAQAPTVSDEYMDMLYDKISRIGKDDILVLAGRMSRENHTHSFLSIMERLKFAETKVIVDTTGDMLLDTLARKPFLIKPNHKELSEIVGRELDPADTETIAKNAMKLRELGARNVLVSLGEEGAVLVCEDDRVISCKAPKGRVVNTVGAGDSMVAGFIAGYLRSADYEQALAMGVRVGSETAFSEGLAQ